MKSASDGQLLLSIGALLASEREKRGITVERAAKETRMRPQRIRDMENDDLSYFSNPSYARMFLIAYAKYLGIPMRTINEHLPDRGEAGPEGYQYISTSAEEMPSIRHDIATRPRGNNVLTALVVLTFIVVLGALGLGGYYLVVNADRLYASVNKPEPTPVPAQVILLEPVVLSNLPASGTAAAAFEGEVEIAAAPPAAETAAFEEGVEMAAPPTPKPEVMTVRKPTPALSVTTAPGPAAEATPESVLSEDQAFLLGSSPEAKPAEVQ